MIRALLMLGSVLALMAAGRSFAPVDAHASPGAGTVLGFGFLVLAALQAGSVFAALRLPRLTGYLLCGVLTGPDALGLLTRAMVGDLRLVNGVAVSLIALTAGGELDLRALRPRLRSVVVTSLLALISAIVAITLTSILFSSRLPFMVGLSGAQQWSVALTLGVLLASLSPAVTIAIFSETGSDGPVSETSLGVVVLADILIIVAFTAVHALDASVFHLHGGGELSPLLKLSIEIGGSAVVGALVALAILAWHRIVREHLSLFILAVCIIATEVGSRLHLDALLVCLVAGLLLQNVLGLRGEVLAKVLAPAGLPIYAVFFALAGANLQLAELAVLWPLALLFSVVRAGALLGSARAGAKLTGAGEMVERWMPLALIPQAGVSVGLAELLGRHFPDWGAGTRALVLSVMTVNVVVGPLLLRYGLARAGETGRKAAEEH
ncbi:MAG: cation:proton antiporter [Polyangiales bacterium]